MTGANAFNRFIWLATSIICAVVLVKNPVLGVQLATFAACMKYVAS